MPIYEYKCPSCGYTTELLQKMNDPKVPVCLKCNISMKKLIAPSTFILKGTGWYKATSNEDKFK